MLMDCSRCPVAGAACRECAVGVLLSLAPASAGPPSAGPPGPGVAWPAQGGMPLDAAERRGVAAFVAAGLVHPDEADALRSYPDAAALAV